MPYKTTIRTITMTFTRMNTEASVVGREAEDRAGVAVVRVDLPAGLRVGRRRWAPGAAGRRRAGPP